MCKRERERLIKLLQDFKKLFGLGYLLYKIFFFEKKTPLKPYSSGEHSFMAVSTHQIQYSVVSRQKEKMNIKALHRAALSAFEKLESI